MAGDSFTIEVRDPSDPGRAEIEAAAVCMGGRVEGSGLHLKVSASWTQGDAIHAMLQNDSRVVSDE